MFITADYESFQLTQSFLDHFGPVSPRCHYEHHRVLTEPDDSYETQIKWLIARGNQPEISKLLDVSPGYLLDFGDNYSHLYLKFNCNRATGMSFLQGDRAEFLILFKLREI